MQYRQLVCALICALVLALNGLAQQPAKVRKPVKNPPQYPNIIDMEGQAAPGAKPAPPPTQEPTAVPVAAVPVTDALVNVLESLTSEVKTLVGEIRSLNLRQQAQLDVSRLTRLDLRIDHFEREIKPVRERIQALEAEEQQLAQMTTRESLYAQTERMATMDREATMRQLKQQHEYRLNLVRYEKERLKVVEADLAKQLAAVRSAGTETELRLQQIEAELKRGND
jgi:hypothetical protein